MSEQFQGEVTFTVDLKKDAPKDFPNLLSPTRFEFKAESVLEG